MIQVQHCIDPFEASIWPLLPYLRLLSEFTVFSASKHRQHTFSFQLREKFQSPFSYLEARSGNYLPTYFQNRTNIGNLQLRHLVDGYIMLSSNKMLRSYKHTRLSLFDVTRCFQMAPDRKKVLTGRLSKNLQDVFADNDRRASNNYMHVKLTSPVWPAWEKSEDAPYKRRLHNHLQQSSASPHLGEKDLWRKMAT